MMTSHLPSVRVRNGCVVSWLRKLDQEETLLGVVDILYTPHHIYFIRVHDLDGTQQPVDDPHGRYDELAGIAVGAAGTAMETVRVPGYPGDYVTIVHPFGS